MAGGGGYVSNRGAAVPSFGVTTRGLATAAAAGVGAVVFSLFIWQLTGRPLAWLEGHAAWGRSYRGLASVVTDRYKYISDNGVEGYFGSLPHDVLNGLGVVFVLAATVPVARSLGLAYAVFILINILPPLAAGQLLSAGRFSSVLFPAFVWFAQRCRRGIGRAGSEHSRRFRRSPPRCFTRGGRSSDADRKAPADVLIGVAADNAGYHPCSPAQLCGGINRSGTGLVTGPPQAADRRRIPENRWI